MWSFADVAASPFGLPPLLFQVDALIKAKSDELTKV